MTRQATTPPRGQRAGLRRVAIASATVWFVDGWFAMFLCLYMSDTCTATRLWQSVASGLIGRSAAFAGGALTALVGLAVHFGISSWWSTVYFMLYRRWDALRRLTTTWRGVAAASIAYGMLIQLAMNLVIVRYLSGARPGAIISWGFLQQLLGLPLSAGLPITAIVRDRYKTVS